MLVPPGAAVLQPTPVNVGRLDALDTAVAARFAVGSAVGSPHEDSRTPGGLYDRTGVQSAAGTRRPEPSAHAQTLYVAACVLGGTPVRASHATAARAMKKLRR
jgi:hypothetical protein